MSVILSSASERAAGVDSLRYATRRKFERIKLDWRPTPSPAQFDFAARCLSTANEFELDFVQSSVKRRRRGERHNDESRTASRTSHGRPTFRLAAVTMSR